MKQYAESLKSMTDAQAQQAGLLKAQQLASAGANQQQLEYGFYE